MTDKTSPLPYPVWSGSFNLFGVEMKCHTLSDGRRIIEAKSVEALLQAVADGGSIEREPDFEGFAKWRAHGRT